MVAMNLPDINGNHESPGHLAFAHFSCHGPFWLGEENDHGLFQLSGQLYPLPKRLEGRQLAELLCVCESARNWQPEGIARGEKTANGPLDGRKADVRSALFWGINGFGGFQGTAAASFPGVSNNRAH